MDRSPSKQVAILQNLVSIAILVVDIKVAFVCHVTMQDHVIKVINGVMVRSPTRCVIILPSSMAIGHHISGDIIVLVFQVILQVYVMK